MVKSRSFVLPAVLTAALLAAFFAAQPVQAAPVTILVNGQQVQFDQPPVERSGRVFVPLRGVFERLGASVVYDNGVINASGNGRTISLRIGSNSATVNGSTEQLDVAPFLIGSRTLVPLRFISQALGASVDYNNGSRTVTVSMAGGGNASYNTNTGGGGNAATVALVDVAPGSGAVVEAKSPAVSGRFSEAMDPNSVRITLDGRDVSATTDISANDFLFSPQYPLRAEQHTVHVTGRAQSGARLDQSWSFVSGTSVVENYIRNVTPANGSTVGGSFNISGTTLPNSHVKIVVVPSAVFGGVFRVGTGTYQADTIADASGHFSQDVNVQTVGGGNVSVRIISTAPTTNAGATVDLNLKS
jgi:hypothetical protein